MPLSELPDYLASVREHGQGEDIPVVDIGMIVDAPAPFNWLRAASYSVAASLLVGVGALAYTAGSTMSITIVANAGKMSPQTIAEIVSGEGGRVFSVRQKEEGAYEVRVFTLKSIGSFLEQLRKNKDLKRVDLE